MRMYCKRQTKGVLCLGEVIYLVIYMIGKLTDLIYNHRTISFALLLISIVVGNFFLLKIKKTKGIRTDKIALVNLIVIIVGIGTITNKALTSSFILILFDFAIIYSLLLFLKKSSDFISRLK